MLGGGCRQWEGGLEDGVGVGMAGGWGPSGTRSAEPPCQLWEGLRKL